MIRIHSLGGLLLAGIWVTACAAQNNEPNSPTTAAGEETIAPEQPSEQQSSSQPHDMDVEMQWEGDDSDQPSRPRHQEPPPTRTYSPASRGIEATGTKSE